jgi:CRP-like cAMP-binding protein
VQNVQLDPTAFVADSELISALEQRSTRIPCETDRILFHQGDSATGVFIIHEGAATVTMNAVSDEPVLTLRAAPGSLLGLPGIIANQPYSLTARAHQGSQVLFISREDFTDLMRSNPQLSLKVLQVLAAEVRTARRALY